jgi:hypothetical protein
LKLTDRGIPENIKVPGQNDHSHFIAFDFGICENAAGELEPQLIEMQGFPTLFAFQAYHSELTAEYANLPATYSPYLNGYTKTTYLEFIERNHCGYSSTRKCHPIKKFSQKSKKPALTFIVRKKHWE